MYLHPTSGKTRPFISKQIGLDTKREPHYHLAPHLFHLALENTLVLVSPRRFHGKNTHANFKKFIELRVYSGCCLRIYRILNSR